MPVDTRFRLALIAVIVTMPLFFVDLGSWRRVFAPELHVFSHVGFFTLLGWVLMRTRPLLGYAFPARGALVILLCLAVGGIIELLQPYFGRGSGLQDLWQNLLGACLAVAASAPSGLPRRALSSIMVLVLAVELQTPIVSLWDRGVARWQFPVLSDFSTPLEQHRWSAGIADTEHVRTGGHALRVDLEPARFAGTAMRRSLGDWTGYDALRLSLYNDSEQPLTLTISIRDRQHLLRGGYSDRFNRRYRLGPGWSDLRIPLDDVRDAPQGRTMEMDDIIELAVFTTNLEDPRTIYLDDVRLIRE